MKIIKFNNSKITLLLGLIIITMVGCDRDLTDDATPAVNSTNGDVFIDAPIAMGTYFYLPFEGSNFDAISFVDDEGYESSSSVRVDVPNADDPNGNYAGAIFRVDGPGRDLSGFDALTFWAKASQGVNVGEVGFGLDFIEDKYQVAASGISVGTNWAKYVIPIPDASKLLNERGLFWYAAGTQGTGGSGYTLWFDEIKFEKLGTVAQPRPAILDGEDEVVQTFIGNTGHFGPYIETFNLGSGQDVTVVCAPSYFEFTSSNPSVVSVDEFGIGTALSVGEAVVTATLGGIEADGSYTSIVLGEFTHAPTPTADASNVISIYSDEYNNVPVDFYNGYWEPWQTTESADIYISGDNILNYTNFNFVGNQFSMPTIDATSMDIIHFDVFVPEGTTDQQLMITLKDFGSDIADGGGDDTTISSTFSGSSLIPGQWNSIEISMDGLSNKDNFGQIIYENLGSGLTSFYLDNIYLYRLQIAPSNAAPIPTIPAANVISIFSDTYTNVNSDLNPDWGQSTVVTQELIDGNNTLKYGGLNYQGLQLNTPQDVSGMTHLHIDYYTANSTALNAYLVSTGPVETPKTLTVPTSSDWVSIEIPLSDFSPVDLADIIQLKFDGNGDIYLDNIYFHN